MADKCQFPEVIPDYVTYIELAISVVITIIFTIIGYNHDSILDKDNTSDNHTNKTKTKNCCSFFTRLFQKHTSYSLLAAHIFDQATDMGVIVQYYIMAFVETNSKCKNAFTNENINFRAFFYASISAFLFYRFISSIWILVITKFNIVRGILQIILDFEIYR
eukprot:292486_1